MKTCLFPDQFCAGFVLGAAAGWVEARPGERAERAHQVVEGVRLQEIPSRELAGLLERPGLQQVREWLAALERLSPLRQSATFKMVYSRRMEIRWRWSGSGASGRPGSPTRCLTTTLTTVGAAGGSLQLCLTSSAATARRPSCTTSCTWWASRRTSTASDFGTTHSRIRGAARPSSAGSTADSP